MANLESTLAKPWYRRPATIIWLLLAILSFGLLIPSWIASARLLKYRTYICTFNCVSMLTALFLNTPSFSVAVWALALTISLVFRKKDITKYLVSMTSPDENLNDVENAVEKKVTDKQEETANSSTLPSSFHTKEPKQIAKAQEVEVTTPKEKKEKPGIGQWLKFEFITRGKVRKLKKRIDKQTEYVGIVKENLEKFQSKSSKFDFGTLGSEYEVSLIEVLQCSLIETRKGARVTVRESTYSGGYGGGSVRLGAFSVGGGRSGGSSSSTSISYPAPDELQIIDQGKFILTNLKASIVGTMFTKTTEFKKLVDYATQGRQILFAPKTGSKVWIVEFPNYVDAWLASCFLTAAFETPEKRLDKKATSFYGTLSDAVVAQFKRAIAELEITLTDGQSELSKLSAEYSSLQEQFPTKIAELK